MRSILLIALIAGMLLSIATQARDAAPKASGAEKVHAEGGDYWNQFRGPNRDGKSLAKNLPVEFGETRNVCWKTPIHDKGWSSPVVWGNQIWLTTGREDGSKLFAVCVHSDSGEIVHDIKVFDVADPQKAYGGAQHPRNTYSSYRGGTHLCSLWDLRHRMPGH